MAKPGKSQAATAKEIKQQEQLLESEWLKIGLSAPARRALVEAKLYKVSDLRRISLAELTSLHGLGKSAIARIKVIMAAKKISFRL
jgi:DNA-directed RNA polymerase alpha subunit